MRRIVHVYRYNTLIKDLWAGGYFISNVYFFSFKNSQRFTPDITLIIIFCFIEILLVKNAPHKRFGFHTI